MKAVYEIMFLRHFKIETRDKTPQITPNVNVRQLQIHNHL